MYSSQTRLAAANDKPQKGDAAVLIALAGEGEQQQILLTRRSKRMNSHRGEVALPGGMWEPQDACLQATALREAHEEVGLPPAMVTPVAAMPVRATRQGTRVTPFIAQVPENLPLVPCQYELESLFWLPLAILAADQRQRTDIFIAEGQEYWAPVYRFSGYKIWGFTARLLVDYLNRFHGAHIGRAHSAEEVIYRAR
ncbi:NUDIX hydrolase [Marinagarivorans cellulosilyticus]|uniref:Nudix hydrolase domain-containing protein n=1 Tax=Marinagarivorans cellulosilyticus TaxID=2721545 RepID=A0AAN2BJS9_9GAMM|nr:CoA pyrophosphatase [Marinagarivorans cellulosilyticus]BCD97249.1 hypothetical protein MARGE09_P1450 [Marinagarivorans cellulosilyticus]